MKVSKTTVGLALLALLALGLRLVYLQQSEKNPFFDTPVVDARGYVDLAQSLADGNWQGPPMPFWQPPLYPYFLAVLFYLFGVDYYLPLLLQAAIGAASCILLFVLARRIFSLAVAWVAAAAAALYGPFIYFGGELLPTTWGVTGTVLVVLSLLWAASSQGWGRWLGAGLILGATTLLVANTLLFAVVAAFWACVFVPAPGTGGPALEPYLNRTRLVQLAAFFLGIALVLGPVTLRNRIVGGEWVLISYNYGVNFYIGNNPDYDQTLEIRPGRQWLELVNTPEREANIEGYGAGARYFIGKSWDFFVAQPGAFLALQLRKFHLFWHGDEIRRNLDLYFARNHSSLLQILLWKYGLAFPFGVVSALALFGLGHFLLSPARKTAAGSLALLCTATYMGSVLLFFVTSRHRLPAVPLLLLFAAYGAVSLARQRGRKQLLCGSIVLALLITVNAGVGTMNTEGDAYQHYLTGVALEDKGMKTNALQAYRRAVAMDPTHEGGLAGLAAISGRLGREEEAAAVWGRLLEHYPDRDDIRLKLADLHLLKAEYSRAIPRYRELLSRQPEWAALHGRLGYAYAMDGAFAEAEAAYRQTLAIKPDSLLVHYQLAHLYEESERPQKAEAEYLTLLEKQPNLIESLADLGRLLASGGRAQAAAPYLHSALSIDPHYKPALLTLGTLEAKAGRYEAAKKHYQTILDLDPEHLAARRALAHLLVKTGEKERGDAEYERYQHRLRQERMRRQTQRQTGEIMNQMLQKFNPAGGSPFR